jgi:hypothetical protein
LGDSEGVMSGRIRTVKPEWLEDSKMARLSDSDRLLSVALLLVADDHGRGRAEPEFIASRAWTYDPREGVEKAREGLASLSRAGFVTLYRVEEQWYFEIRNWRKHQKVDKPSAPRVPGPDQADSDTCEQFAEGSGVPREEVAKPRVDLAPDPDLRTPYPVSPSGSPAREGAHTHTHETLRDGHLTSEAIAAELATHPQLRAVAAEPDIVGVLLSRAMASAKRPAWLADAIAEAAADTTSGEQVHVTRKRLRAYCDGARRPRVDAAAADPAPLPKLPPGTGELPPVLTAQPRPTAPREPPDNPVLRALGASPRQNAPSGQPGAPTAIGDLLAGLVRPEGTS